MNDFILVGRNNMRLYLLELYRARGIDACECLRRLFNLGFRGNELRLPKGR